MKRTEKKGSDSVGRLRKPVYEQRAWTGPCLHAGPASALQAQEPLKGTILPGQAQNQMELCFSLRLE